MAINHNTKKPKQIKQAIRKLVWFHYIGNKKATAYCMCCGVTKISVFEFECGHVIAKSKGGPDTVQNLRPICSLCNKSMGNQNMLEFQKIHGLPKSVSWTTYLLEYFF